MSKFKKLFFAILYVSLLAACSSGSGGSTNVPDFGSISFSRNNVQLSSDGTATAIITLNGSSGVSGALVSLSVTESNIVTINPSSCTLSTGINTCQIIVKAQAPGSTTIQASASYGGHIYTISPVSVNVAQNSNAGFIMTESGITQTIYNDQSYNPIFIFTNNTNSAINLGDIEINGESALGATIDDAGCVNQLLAANGGYCTMTATGVSIPAANKLVPLNFVLHGSGANSNDVYNFDMNIVAVRDYSAQGYAAFRINNVNNPNHKLYIVATGDDSLGKQYLIQFTSNANGDLMGSLAPTATTYPQASVLVPNDAIGITLYQSNYSGLPGGIGGLMYVSLDKPIPIESGGATYPGAVGPSPNTGLSSQGYGVSFSVYEPNVYLNNGVLNTFTDVTDINFVGVTQGFRGVDITTDINRKSGFVADGYDGLTTTKIYDQIESDLQANWPTSWGVSGIFLKDPNWIMIFGFANWLGGNPIQYDIFGSEFSQTLYTSYVMDLWSYYQNNTMYIDAGEISPGCILTAQVSGESMLVQPQNSSLCPENVASGVNTWYWSRFTAADFVGGAASNPPSTLWGPNKTYQSMGKYIAAAQNVGFLPYCTNASIVYGPNLFKQESYQQQYWAEPTGQYSCLANAGTYGDSIMNQYDKVFHEYIPLNYAWAFDDALGISSAVQSDATKYGVTLEVHKFD